MNSCPGFPKQQHPFSGAWCTGSISLLFLPEWQSPLKFGSCRQGLARRALCGYFPLHCLIGTNQRKAMFSLPPSLADTQHAWSSFGRECICRSVRSDSSRSPSALVIVRSRAQCLLVRPVGATFYLLPTSMQRTQEKAAPCSKVSQVGS